MAEFDTDESGALNIEETMKMFCDQGVIVDNNMNR